MFSKTFQLLKCFKHLRSRSNFAIGLNDSVDPDTFFTFSKPTPDRRVVVSEVLFPPANVIGALLFLEVFNLTSEPILT